MPDRSNSIDSLRMKSELCRAELKETISAFTLTLSDTTDEIKTTFSPSHLKDEARAYAKEKQAQAVETLKEKIASHPLQALAIGAIAAYPFLGIVRRVPVPLALIGAGLLLSRNSISSNGTRPRNGEDESASKPGEEGQGRPSTFQDMQMSAAEAGAKAKEALRAGTASAFSGAASAGADVAAQATRASEQTRDALARLAQRNPLLLGGVAVAIGGFIAASLPASRVEEQVLTSAKGTLRDAGRKAAAEVVKGAKAQASEIAKDVTAAARREGLTEEALDQAVGEATEKVASVVDRAVDAAIGTEPADGDTAYGSDGDQNARL